MGFFSSLKEKKKEETMTFEDIKLKLDKLNSEFKHHYKNCTSVQVKGFIRKFEEKNDVKTYGDKIIINNPIIIDDICSVKNVRKVRIMISSFWGESYENWNAIDCTNGFSFNTPLSSARTLNRGQKIRVYGKCNAELYIDSDTFRKEYRLDGKIYFNTI